MSLSVSCECGRSYQTKKENAGKKFRCKSCGNMLSVPTASRRRHDAVLDTEVEDYGDYDEDLDDYATARVALPRRRTPSRRRKATFWSRFQWPSLSMPEPLPLIGAFFRIIATIYLVFALPGTVLAFLFFKLIGLGIMLASIISCFLGMKGAGGQGIPISRDNYYEGDGSIVLGIILIVIGIVLPGVVFVALSAAIRS